MYAILKVISVFPLVSLVLLILYILKLYYKKRKIAKFIDKLPGPPTVPIFGNTLQMIGSTTEMFQCFLERTELYGPMYRVWTGPVPVVHISKPEFAEIILASSSHVEKSRLYKFLKTWLGNGLVTGSRDIWRKHRKLINPTFHPKILENFFEVFVEKGEILADLLEDKCDQTAFDVFPAVTRCTLDIIGETAFGVPLHTQTNPELDFVAALYNVQDLTIQRTARLWLHPTLFFNLSSIGKKYYENLKIVQDYGRKIIKERKLNRAKLNYEQLSFENKGTSIRDTKKRLVFLDLLLEVSADGAFSDEEVREEVDTFLSAGHDTLSTSLCWTLYMLGSHQEYQEKVADELDEIFGNTDRRVTLEDLNKMKYMEMCIKETLRLFPSVPLLGRHLKEDVVINGYHIPKGTDIAIFTYQIHRCPEQFSNPEKFNPDNFLAENIRKRSAYSYLAFSAGPRNCIGQKYALMEMKTILSRILRLYKIESVEKLENITLTFRVILRPENGIWLRIAKRNHNF